jgi:hypothetical protein
MAQFEGVESDGVGRPDAHRNGFADSVAIR